MSQIKITLPEYIKNIFNNSYIYGENDYITNIFDDRNINLGAFYELNFEIYKALLIDEKYNDKDFLTIKKNLFYLTKAWVKKEINFIYSEYFGRTDFLKKELKKAWTKFDIFYSNVYRENSKQVINYLKKIKWVKKILQDALYGYFLLTIFSEPFLNREDLFDFIKNLFSDEEIKLLIKENPFSAERFLILFVSKKWLKYFKKLNISTDIWELIKNSNYNFQLNLLDIALESDISIDFIKFLNIDSVLVDWFENYNEDLSILKEFLRHKSSLDYLEKLWLSKAIFKENNKNFNWLVEKLCYSEYWKEYLKKINKDVKNEYINDFLNKIEEHDNSVNKINSLNIKKNELVQIKRWNIKLEEKLYEILRNEEWIKFLEENYENQEISKYLVKSPKLFTNLCNTDNWVKYLRKLNLDEEIIEQIKEESKKWQIYALLAHLLMTDEWINYLKYLNKDNILKENLLKEVLVFNKSQFQNLDKFKDLYIKDNIIQALKWNHAIAEWFDSLFHSLSDTQEWISYIIESDVKNKIRKSILETIDYHYIYTLRLFNDTEKWKQYLKDILNLETDNTKNQVYEFIKNSSSGSCLLSWYRWTWKTSLLNNAVDKLQNEDWEEITKVIINIPEQKIDDKWNKKAFNKNELITKIIREIYLALVKNWYSKNDIKNFEEQYIRTFKNIEDIEWFIHLKERWFLKIAIDILSFSFPIFLGLIIDYILWKLSISFLWFSFWLWLDFIKLFSAFILIILNFLIFRTIINITYRARIERSLYNEDIAEYRLNENILKFNKNIINLLYKILWYEINLKYLFIFAISFILLFWIFKISIMLLIYLSVIILFTWIFICLYYLVNFLVDKLLIYIKFVKLKSIWKNRKLVIIIDELDKLLDLDKWIWKWNIDMKDIFDLLGKLKTLFFDNCWAIFFVVTNKDAYNYYLENKHSEDDLVSNIFNKVLYLPMVKKENFNLNRTFSIEWNDIQENPEYRQNRYINDWLYYKSHWNWRKASFILSQSLNNWQIVLDKITIDYEMKFYNFIDKLYDLFIWEDNDNFKDKFNNNFTPWKDLYEFIDKFILKWEFIDKFILKW